MGALAGLLKARGLEVTGSDKKLYPPMSTALADWGIDVTEGFSAEPIERGRPDLIVIGNAVHPDNPEAIAAIASGVPYRSFSDALYEPGDCRQTLHHGQRHPRQDHDDEPAGPSAGGDGPGRLRCSWAASASTSAAPFVKTPAPISWSRGDEYDTAFFDKTPKFLHYHPDTLILTSVEFDHADIYRDLDHVKSAFRTLLRQMPKTGRVFAALGHEGVRDVAGEAACEVIGYGVQRAPGAAPPAGVRWWASELDPAGERMRFQLNDLEKGRSIPAESPLFGTHNIENIVAVLAVLDSLGVPIEEALVPLRTHQGVKRRQEVRGTAAGVTIIDDFAHHPTAVKGTIEAIAQQHGRAGEAKGGRVIALLEPRTNTSRRAIFQDDYIEALAAADRVAIAEVGNDPIYSATGEVTETLSSSAIAESLRRRGQDAAAFEEIDDIVNWVVEGREPGDTVLVMSNGAFGGIWGKLLAALREAEATAGRVD